MPIAFLDVSDHIKARLEIGRPHSWIQGHGARRDSALPLRESALAFAGISYERTIEFARERASTGRLPGRAQLELTSGDSAIRADVALWQQMAFGGKPIAVLLKAGRIKTETCHSFRSTPSSRTTRFDTTGVT